MLRKLLKIKLVLSLFLVGMVASAQMSGATYTDYGPVLDNVVFANTGTEIFGYLVAAAVAGLGLLVARIGVRRIWTFLRSFF